MLIELVDDLLEVEKIAYNCHKHKQQWAMCGEVMFDSN